MSIVISVKIVYILSIVTAVKFICNLQNLSSWPHDAVNRRSVLVGQAQQTSIDLKWTLVSWVGDLNSKVSSDYTFLGYVMGRHALRRMFVGFCGLHCLAIGSSWVSIDQHRTGNHICYFAIRSRFLGCPWSHWPWKTSTLAYCIRIDEQWGDIKNAFFGWYAGRQF